MWSTTQRLVRSEGFYADVCLIEAMEELANGDGVHWYVLRMEDGHVMGAVLEFEAQG